MFLPKSLISHRVRGIDIPPLFRCSLSRQQLWISCYRREEKGKRKRLPLIESYRRPGMSESILGRDKTVNFMRRKVAKRKNISQTCTGGLNRQQKIESRSN